MICRMEIQTWIIWLTAEFGCKIEYPCLMAIWNNFTGHTEYNSTKDKNFNFLESSNEHKLVSKSGIPVNFLPINIVTQTLSHNYHFPHPENKLHRFFPKFLQLVQDGACMNLDKPGY